MKLNGYYYLHLKEEFHKKNISNKDGFLKGITKEFYTLSMILKHQIIFKTVLYHSFI